MKAEPWGPGSTATALSCILKGGGPPLQPMAKLVLLTLTMRVNGKAQCVLSLKQLAASVGVSEQVTKRCLTQLESAGLLERQQTPGRSTLYTLFPPWEPKKGGA